MNKWILITGSSRGIGRETALYLAENGYNIVLHCSKNTSRLDSLKEQIIRKGVEARAVAFDIKNREETEHALLLYSADGCGTGTKRYLLRNCFKCRHSKR